MYLDSLSNLRTAIVVIMKENLLYSKAWTS